MDSQVVDPARRLHRRVHAAAGHHDRQRRAAVHPAGVPCLAVGSAVGDRRLRADAGRIPAHRRIGRAICSGAGSCSRSASSIFTVGSLALRARAASHASCASPARFQGVGGAIMFATSLALLAAGVPRQVSAASRSACSARSPASPSRSARCSAARSPAGCRWRWIFFVNLPIGVARAHRHAARGRRVRAPVRAPARLARAS